MSMQIVYKSDRYEIELHNPQHRKLVATFDFWERGKSGFAPSKPTELIAESNMAELRIKTRDNDWFLSDELEDLMRIIAETASRYDEVMNYSGSMGGFGALLFSRATGAAKVFLISPQYSIDRAIVPFETRWETEAAALGLQAIDPKVFGSRDITGLVIFDPMIELDRLQAETVLRAFPGLTALKLPFGGHPAGKALHEAGLLGVMGRDIVNGRATPQSIRALFKVARRQSPLYWLMLGAANVKRRPGLAEFAFREVLARASTASPTALFRAGNGLSALGDHSGVATMRAVYDAQESPPRWWTKVLRIAERKAAASAKARSRSAVAK